ncbi:MAG: peptide ABC transporter substrate-binding protein [Planctomycetales bacterium]|nr:peptide ABC transporter substrate-binding protein [Planctomycetales bacterium]
MPFNPRNLFPYFAGLLALAALGYAVTFGKLPPADFTFINGTEVQSIDAGKVSGVPEHRIIEALFEGLFRQDPQSLKPIPGVAARHEVSADGRTYDFYLRPNARWSNGSPVTAHDFWWSWRRVLHPETAGEYAYQLYYLENAEKYNSAQVEVRDRVEIELDDRLRQVEPFPRGTMVRGTLRDIIKPDEPEIPATATRDERNDFLARWKRAWVYVVDIDGEQRRFSPEAHDAPTVEKCLQVLLDFDEVGVQVVDDRHLRVQLTNSTPFFLHLMAFYSTFPLHRESIEHYGRDWTKPQNLVNNGAFRMAFRRIRDRIRLVKNPEYWDADRVHLNVVDAMAVNSPTTMLNMYMNGQVDWAETIPTAAVPDMLKHYQEHVRSAPMLTTYMYRLNTKRKPLDDVRVRKALAMAMNKREICELILRAGQQPARSLVPPGMEGYEQAEGVPYDVEQARQLLAEAGFPDGKGMRKLEILYNDHEAHKTIAEKIQSDWLKNLNVRTELKALEWGVYLDSINQFQYDVARYAWVGDYPDPNTFLDMFLTDGTNNRTGWSEPKYDELIAAAAAETAPEKRLQTLHDAERILMDGQPIIPIYYYVSLNLVRPYVHGFHTNVQDLHPLSAIRIDPEEKSRHLRALK